VATSAWKTAAAKCVHIVNRESVEGLGKMLGAKVDVRRFRPNLVIGEIAPWRELDLVGRKLRSGSGTVLQVFKRTERCAATNVDPETGVRDLKIPSFLSKTLGHCDFGVYASLTVAPSRPATPSRSPIDRTIPSSHPTPSRHPGEGRDLRQRSTHALLGLIETCRGCRPPPA
jgi:hypothetical protein